MNRKPRVIKARGTSICPRCGKHIRNGDKISNKYGPWMCIACVLARDGTYIPRKYLDNQAEECAECGNMAWHETLWLSPTRFGWVHGYCIGGTTTAW